MRSYLISLFRIYIYKYIYSIWLDKSPYLWVPTPVNQLANSDLSYTTYRHSNDFECHSGNRELDFFNSFVAPWFIYPCQGFPRASFEERPLFLWFVQVKYIQLEHIAPACGFIETGVSGQAGNGQLKPKKYLMLLYVKMTLKYCTLWWAWITFRNMLRNQIRIIQKDPLVCKTSIKSDINRNRWK